MAPIQDFVRPDGRIGLMGTIAQFVHFLAEET